jgi:hypothetical protein
VNEIDEIRDAIRKIHHVESRHVQSVPIKESFRGQTVWEGIVEVFDLEQHYAAKRLYAWMQKVEGGKKRIVTVLHLDPIQSPRDAVRASILQEYRNAEAES